MEMLAVKTTKKLSIAANSSLGLALIANIRASTEHMIEIAR